MALTQPSVDEQYAAALGRWGLDMDRTAEAAVVALTESLALELAPEVLVNAIAPGPILAPPDLTPAENAEVLNATPLRRWGDTAEIAKTVLFLVESDFVTGECIRVDGGRHLY